MVEVGQRKRFWADFDLSKELKDFINCLLRLNPKERLGAKGWEEVKNHPFFTMSMFDWK
jgi:serine/threonine protein kinase